MNKVVTPVMTILLMLCLFAFPGCTSKGEVKVDLVKYGTQNVVGSATLNTTEDGVLNVQVNMDTEPNLKDYDVVAIMVYSDPSEGLGAPDKVEYFADLLDTDAKGQGSVLVINIDGDFQGNMTVKCFLFEQTLMPEFFQGIGGIGYQFAHKDIAFGVQGVNNDVQEFFYLGLEFHGFNLGCCLCHLIYLFLVETILVKDSSATKAAGRDIQIAFSADLDNNCKWFTAL